MRRTRHRFHWIAFLSAIYLSGICAGDSLTLPLEGYFHPGRGMPVRWEFSQSPAPDSDIVLSGEGAITTRVSAIESSAGIFPWLILQPDVNQIRAQAPAENETFPQPLHPLSDAQKLVGVTGDDLSEAAELFPGESVIPIRLDSLHPIIGAAMAWESLDGLILPPGQWRDIPAETRQGLFAAGVVIAVSGDNQPDDLFSWQRAGALWVARSIPLPEPVNPDAFAPIEGWIAAAPAQFRREIFLLGVLFAISACAIGLLPNHWMPAAIAGFSLAFCGIVAAQYSAPRISRISGIVQIAQPAPLADLWTFLQSHRDADFNVAAPGIALPILSDPSQAARCHLVLNCDKAGEPKSLSGQLQADEPIALFSRALAAKIDPASAPVTSPLRALVAPAIYPGLSIAGQQTSESSPPDADASWPTILLK
jgi:hypothetical protein